MITNQYGEISAAAAANNMTDVLGFICFGFIEFCSLVWKIPPI